MTWTIQPGKHRATNEHGYKITWADNRHGTYFNAYSPRGTHIAAGYDKEIVKAECEVHREKLAKARAMHAAKKAAKEVA